MFRGLASGVETADRKWADFGIFPFWEPDGDDDEDINISLESGESVDC